MLAILWAMDVAVSDGVDDGIASLICALWIRRETDNMRDMIKDAQISLSKSTRTENLS